MKVTPLRNEVIDMRQFYRKQMISQCDQLIAMVRQLPDERIAYRPLHNALNEALLHSE